MNLADRAQLAVVGVDAPRLEDLLQLSHQVVEVAGVANGLTRLLQQMLRRVMSVAPLASPTSRADQGRESRRSHGHESQDRDPDDRQHRDVCHDVNHVKDLTTDRLVP